MNKEKIESIALSGLVSIAFSIVISFENINFDKMPVIILLWAVICGVIIGNKETKSIYLNYKLSIIPSLVIVLAPPIAALVRGLLATASGVAPNIQSFLGYSIFNPGWYMHKPGQVSIILVSSFIVFSIILTIANLAGGIVLLYLSRAYTAGPAAFERVEQILKRIVSILSILGVSWFLSR